MFYYLFKQVFILMAPEKAVKQVEEYNQKLVVTYL